MEGGEMVRKSLSLRLVLVLAALVAVAVLIGDSPWGPT
jgi:hypothetical protein